MHQSIVFSIEFTSDGSTLIARNSRQVNRWDAQTGQPCGEPLLHADTVKSVACGAAQPIIATACDNGTAHLWDVSPTTIRQPDPEELERLRLSIEVRSWQMYDAASGLVQPLSLEEWISRRSQLAAMGGPNDIQSHR